ncbi:hypothetical protein [Streptomyces spinoverrucosus]|uniref:hypothetical protein n=1 Tax=Streptomyces spinoverrucosus TaxID=284043 RepID=UPI001E4BC558|nr:hypothetical protein [Streptomyces spinoverrucosus]
MPISSSRRWVHATLPDEIARSQVTAQIDYGFLGGGSTLEPGTPSGLGFRNGLAVLAAHVRPPGASPGPPAWTEAHIAAFRYFGGVPRPLVPDNLRTGVDNPDLYDPNINKACAEPATHYGALQRAKFEKQVTLEEFDFTVGESVILFGPVGVGKIHTTSPKPSATSRPPGRPRTLRQASRVLADLVGGHADRTREKRIRECVRPDALILDEGHMPGPQLQRQRAAQELGEGLQNVRDGR